MFAALLVTLPIAFIVTFLLAPLWRWIEAAFGVESIGHSGPATWCFVAVEVACVMAACFVVARRS
ncbi:hypothetical protein DWG18_13445 [Lysobacter sp. TY2-98]|nr:hypothetical protein DWG18_13445 [Lysobacter sp. TY2-98]